jgi:hypothetical protein
LDDVRLTHQGKYLVHPEEIERKQSAAVYNMLHLDLKPTINFTHMREKKNTEGLVEEQDKESSGGDTGGGRHRGRQFN